METFPQLLMLKCALYNSNIVIVLSKELFTSFDVLITFFKNSMSNTKPLTKMTATFIASVFWKLSVRLDKQKRN